MILPVAILAGGLATRLRPVTKKTPKVLLEIAGKPFIFHQLELLKRQGIERVVLCIGYLGEQVQNIVDEAKIVGLSIDYSFDGDTLLGTGGALKRALPLLGKEFFVLYGDAYLPCSFVDVQAAYQTSKQAALMTVLENSDQWDRSNVLFQNGRLIEYNKRSPRKEMKYIDYGLGIVCASVFDDYAENQVFDLADIYQSLSLQGGLAGFEVSKRFYEIGSRQGIKETEDFILEQE